MAKKVVGIIKLAILLKLSKVDNFLNHYLPTHFKQNFKEKYINFKYIDL